MSDIADTLAHEITARYYFSREAFTRDEMDSMIARALRRYAAELLYEHRLRALYGPDRAQIAFGLTGRREFANAAEIEAIIRAAVTKGLADAAS